MRRLLLLVAVLVCVDTMLYAALTPLLPHFAHELSLSKGEAGVLVAAYAAGALVGGIPGGLAAARLGSRRSVLAGLTLMGLASLGFAFASAFWSLSVARFVQGVGSAFTWAGAFAWLLAAAPRQRRGELMGTAMGAAIFGAIFGPVIGAGAALVGRAPVFVTVAGLAVVLAAATFRIEPAPAERASTAALARALRSRVFLGGLVLMMLPALLFGVMSVLAPLHLSDADWGAVAIGGLWLGCAALEATEAPLVGRIADRRGRMLPVRVALAVGAVASLGLALGARPLAYVPLVVLATLAWSVLFTPAFVLLADGADAVGLAQGMAFGLMNAAWATGAVVGPAAGGAIAGATGDRVPWLLAAALCAATLAATRRSRSSVSTARVDRLPADAGDPQGRLIGGG
jgi:MFS family permease